MSDRNPDADGKVGRDTTASDDRGDTDKRTVPDGLDYQRYDGTPEEWEYGDPYVGHGVPNRIRQGGATNPMHKTSIGNNGTSLRSHSVEFECENCGHVQRYATSDLQTMGYCRGCNDQHLFVFDFKTVTSSDDSRTISGGDIDE